MTLIIAMVFTSSFYAQQEPSPSPSLELIERSRPTKKEVNHICCMCKETFEYILLAQLCCSHYCCFGCYVSERRLFKICLLCQE